MNITFENPEKISGVLTIVIEEADYQEDVTAQLKKYRKQANIPGFRPGMAPMGIVKRQIGAQVKVDAINKLVGEKLYDYVKENNINMLGEPMPHLGEEPVDLDAPAPYTIKFDIAVAPEFDASLSKEDTVTYYEITVDDAIVEQQIDAFASRAGSYVKVEDYQDNDLIKGDVRELNEDGSTKEGGITVSGATLLPSRIAVEDQKALFNGAKPGDIITFNPKKAYPSSNVEVSSLLNISKEEAENVTADFSFQITEITRYTKHAIDQELFDIMPRIIRFIEVKHLIHSCICRVYFINNLFALILSQDIFHLSCTRISKIMHVIIDYDIVGNGLDYIINFRL